MAASVFPHGRKTRIKGELQRENKLISYERVFKMLENDMYSTVIGQAVLELLSFKVGSGNYQTGISLLQKFSEIFGNMRLISPKMTPYLKSQNFQLRYFLSHLRYELLTPRSDRITKWSWCYENFITSGLQTASECCANGSTSRKNSHCLYG